MFQIPHINEARYTIDSKLAYIAHIATIRHDIIYTGIWTAPTSIQESGRCMTGALSGLCPRSGRSSSHSCTYVHTASALYVRTVHAWGWVAHLYSPTKQKFEPDCNMGMHGTWAMTRSTASWLRPRQRGGPADNIPHPPKITFAFSSYSRFSRGVNNGAGSEATPSRTLHAPPSQK